VKNKKNKQAHSHTLMATQWHTDTDIHTPCPFVHTDIYLLCGFQQKQQQQQQNNSYCRSRRTKVMNLIHTLVHIQK